MKTKTQILFCKQLIIFIVCVFSGRSYGQTVIPAEMPVSSNVTSSGAFNYSLPLEVPPGIRDMVPQLSVTYNSQGGNGNLGYGWSLAGLSAITRANTTIFHNKMLDPVDFDANDVFVLDGQRLIDTGSGNYMTEIKNFAKIQSHGTAGNGPGYFTVEYPSGMTYEYGNSASSQMLAQGKSDALIWAVNKISDKTGNYIEFEYSNTQSTGEYFIEKILYGNNVNSATAVANEIRFIYATRQDQNKIWISGSYKLDRFLLDHVEIYDGDYLTGTLVNQYSFTYDYDHYSHLTEIQEVRDGNHFLPSIKINWGKKDQNHTTPPYSYVLANPSYWNVDNILVGDANGDGATDALSFTGFTNNAQYYVDLNQKNNNFSQSSSGYVNYSLAPTYWGVNVTNDNGIKKGSFYFDYDADGLEDAVLVFPDATDPANPKLVVEYYKSNGTSLNYTARLYEKSMNDNDWLAYCKVLPGDFDGDGKSEILITQPTGFTVDPNTQIKSANDYDLILIGENYPTNNGIAQSSNIVGNINGSLPGSYHPAFALDFDGDGKKEFGRIVHSPPPNSITSMQIYKLNFSYTPSISLANPSNSLTLAYIDFQVGTETEVFGGDFNGDGLEDIITWNSTAGWKIRYATGTGFTLNNLPQIISSNIHPTGPFFQSGGVGPACTYRTGDFNGDGKADLVELGNDANAPYYKIFYFSGVDEATYETNTLPWGCAPETSKVGDFNGDGQSDILTQGSNGGISTAFFLYFHPYDIKHLVTSIEHAGKRLDIEIKSLAQASADPADEIEDFYGLDPWSINGHTPTEYPYVTKQIPIKVVTRLNDNVTLNNTYYYQTLSMHFTGLGILGFEKFKVRNLTTQQLTEHQYSLFPWWGIGGNYSRTNFLYKTTTYTTLSNLSDPISETRHSYVDVPGNTTGDVCLIKEYGTIETNYATGSYTDKNITFSSALFYDFGVPDTIQVDRGVHNSYCREHMIFTYDPHPNVLFHNKSKPITITETRTYPAKATYSRTATFEYNSQGLVTKKIDDPGITGNETDYTYDVYGNVVSTILTYSASGGGVTTPIKNAYVYSPHGRFLIEDNKYSGSVVWSSESYDYNVWGKMTSLKDALNLETLYEYDKVNRLVKTTYADDRVVHKYYDWAYNNVTGDNPSTSFFQYTTITPNHNEAQFLIKTTTDGVLGERYEFYDFQGRKLREAYPKFNGSTVYKDTRYYSQGYVSSATAPYPKGGTPETTDFYYDGYGREVLRVPSTGPSFTTEYETSILPAYLKTTETNDVTGQQKVTSQDATGTYQVEDNGNLIKYFLNSNGKPDYVEINSDPNATTSYTYDQLGRMLTKTEPNAGTTTYQYNNLGQVYKETLPNGTQFNHVYDPVGQLTSKTDQNQQGYLYHYYGGGLLKEQTVFWYGNKVTYEYNYNMHGKLEKLTETIDANHTFVTEYGYNGLGGIASIKYPSNVTVQYTYNSYGFLKEITNGSQKLWRIDGKNHLNQITDIDYFDPSNQTIYTAMRTYDALGNPQMRRVNDISGMFGTPVWWQDYNFDQNTGNMISREDKIHNLIENFSYDPSFNRLTNVNSTNLNTSQPAASPLQMTYNPLGNILNKSDITTSVYDWKYQQYALLTVPDAAPGPNQQILAGVRQPNTQLVEYYAFDRAKKITEAGNEVDFTYGPDNERVKAEYNPGLPGQKVRYYGTNYEQTEENGIITKVNYIWGDDELAAIIYDVQGSTSIYYPVTDYLGSISQILDINGNVVEERSFDAWGRPRDPSNWQYPLPGVAPNWLIDRGFTGHEHVWLSGGGYDFNIINMNARLYDPLTGRMFSPDPYVVDKSRSESFNKYSYAQNNPLKYTDPDGEFIQFVIGAIVGGIAGYKIGQAKGATGWSMFGYIAGGAAIGAATAGVAATVAAGGGVMANTAALIFSSYTASMGMTILTGGALQPNVCYGFGSVNLVTGENNYLLDGDNKWYEDVAYGFGAMANLQDAVALWMGTNVTVNAHVEKHDLTGHSAIYNKDRSINISVAGDGNHYKWSREGSFGREIEYLQQHIIAGKGRHYTPEYHSSKMDIELSNVNGRILKWMTGNLSDGDGLWGIGKLKYGMGFGCMNHTGRSLWAVGIPNFTGFMPISHPLILNLELFIRQQGIYSSSLFLNLD